jgi:predicted dehydrogenase
MGISRRKGWRVEKVNVGILGCGNISGQYFKGCRAFDILEVAACTDLDMSRAAAKAEEFSISKVYTVKELLADPDIQIVVNLTTPDVHASVSLEIIEAGKSVYVEKPLAVTREDGEKVLAAARQRGVLVGCAPDTFLGGGIQTCRKLIDDGWIGTPVAATAFMMNHGPESWHPNPDFYYKVGGGPLFDMGPYYLTALVNLLGGVRRVSGAARKSFPERIATSQMHNGRHIPVEVNTHDVAVLEFASGAIGTLITSFDVWAHTLPRIEIYGSEGSLSVPDPNTFGGPVRVLRAGEKAWTEIPLTHSAEVGRGTGVADMAYALATGRKHRASGELAYHVLDLMHAVEDAARTGRRVNIKSRVTKPAALPLGLRAGALDT